jgi:hypothetical protein
VGIVLLRCPHPQQAKQRAALLIAVDHAINDIFFKELYVPALFDITLQNCYTA